ncbi:MAG: DUF4113 domain-containing protein [Alphaproteobacteria bacterium]
MRALDTLNNQYGRGTIFYAAAGHQRAWRLRSDFTLAAIYNVLGRAPMRG